MYERPKFLKAGDSALVIELGDGINEMCNEKVVALAKELKSHRDTYLHTENSDYLD